MKQPDSDMDVEKVKNHWINTSDEDFKAMMNLFDAKTYHWALFLGHISVEKLLKALYVAKFGKHAPFTHNLFRLAEQCEVEMTDEQADWLDVITSFNINARYDDYKREFYRKCTLEFTEDWIGKIKQIRTWILQML